MNKTVSHSREAETIEAKARCLNRYHFLSKWICLAGLQI
jgi:hypothetical protein